MWEDLARFLERELISVPGVVAAKVDVYPTAADVATLVVRIIDAIEGPIQYVYGVSREPIGTGGRRCS